MNEHGATYGYARVSTTDQNLARQLDALRTFPIADRFVYTDKASGKDFNRPGYKRLLRKLKQNDVLVIKSIDRLGRNYQEIITEWRHITVEIKAKVVVLDMPILDTREEKNGITSVFLADLVLQLMSYIAQIERDNIKSRQAEGIAAAKARGVTCGRPKKEIPAELPKIIELFNAGALTRQQAADALGVSVSTFYRWRTSAGASNAPL